MSKARPLAAAIVVALLSVPLAVMILGALHAPGQPAPVGLELLRIEPTLAAFERAFELVPLGRQLLNSLTVVAIAVPLSVVCASLAGFAMTRLRPPLARDRDRLHARHADDPGVARCGSRGSRSSASSACSTPTSRWSLPR